MECADACKKLRERERFDKVIIGSRIQSSHTIIDKSLRRQNEHGHFQPTPSHFPECLKTADPWQHHIEENEVHLLLREDIESSLSCKSDRYPMASLAEPLGYGAGELTLVLYHKNMD